MIFPYQPISTRDVLRSIERGEHGWHVAALQINLTALGFNVDVDGVFGEQTEIAVRLVQEAHVVVPASGVVGPLTSRVIALTLMWPAQGEFRTPPGLGRGILEGESGFDLACVSMLYTNGTRDVGAWQDNQPQANTRGFFYDGTLFRSFNAKTMAYDTLGKIRRMFDSYVGLGVHSVVAWKLATLYHNRPADADKLARASIGDTSIDWSVIPDTPGWFTIGGVSYSNREWDTKYVADKTKYVTWN